MLPCPAKVSLAAAAALLALSGCAAAEREQASPSTRPSATSSPTPVGLAHAFADTEACLTTLPRLAEAIGPDLTTTYTDDYGSPVEGETYVATDGSIQVSRKSVGMSPEQDAATEAILGPKPERFAPQSEIWHYAANVARGVAAGANDVQTGCVLIMSSPSLLEAPGVTPLRLGDSNASATAAAPEPVDDDDDPMDHQAGDDRITNLLPEPPGFWFEGVSIEKHTKACVAAMIDAVPRLASGQDLAVEKDYASAPNLLWHLSAIAADAPAGSETKARRWLASTDRFGYPRTAVTAQCLAYDGQAVG